MVLTPTYHVFDMYKPFKDAVHLPLDLSAPSYEMGGYKVPAVHASAARGQDGRIYVALANLDTKNAADLSLKIAGPPARTVSGQILTAGTINAINTFEKPDTVKPQPFSGATLRGDRLAVKLPSKSVVVIALK
jgi:alpha-L-arabinofuranosidase